MRLNQDLVIGLVLLSILAALALGRFYMLDQECQKHNLRACFAIRQY